MFLHVSKKIGVQHNFGYQDIRQTGSKKGWMCLFILQCGFLWSQKDIIVPNPFWKARLDFQFLFSEVKVYVTVSVTGVEQGPTGRYSSQHLLS